MSQHDGGEQSLAMQPATRRRLNAVRRPEVYDEDLLWSDGVSVALSVWRGPPGAATILFLPGTMTHPLFYEEALDGLNRAGFNVVGLHYPGHGKSPRARKMFTFPRLVRAAGDAVGYAIRRFGGPVVALGSSQGGIVAMALAATDPRLASVFAHNILDPALPDSLRVTRFPAWLRPAYRVFAPAMRLGARLAPRLPVPFGWYLDIRRVCRVPWTAEQFLTDPLGLRAYPLVFLASLFSADLRGMGDGQIHCPVVVVAATGDPLFPFDYTRRVYARIVAPAKELLVYELDHHLLFNECPEQVLPRLIAKLHEYTGTGRPLVAAPPSG